MSTAATPNWTSNSVAAEQQIRDLVAAWARASEAGDLDAIKPLMDEEILFLTPGNKHLLPRHLRPTLRKQRQTDEPQRQRRRT